MTPLPDRQLLRFVLDHVDIEAICRKRPDLTPEQIRATVAELRRAILPDSPQEAEGPPPTTAVETMAGRAIINTDGASKGNPGPAGIGYVIRDADGKTLAERGRPIGRKTNNQAEYEAVIAALKHARKLGIRRILLRSDSELIVRQVRGEYRVKNPRMAPLHKMVMDLVSGFEEFHCETIPRERNTEADVLASEAAGRNY